jgi:hypothetical protein
VAKTGTRPAITPVKAQGLPGRPPTNLNLNETGELTMATLTIKDLTASKELDSEAMAAVAGGGLEHVSSPLSLALFDITTVSTAFPVYNDAANVSYQANEVGPFNFGVVTQSNDSYQHIDQFGNQLG